MPTQGVIVNGILDLRTFGAWEYIIESDFNTDLDYSSVITVIIPPEVSLIEDSFNNLTNLRKVILCGKILSIQGSFNRSPKLESMIYNKAIAKNTEDDSDFAQLTIQRSFAESYASHLDFSGIKKLQVYKSFRAYKDSDIQFYRTLTQVDLSCNGSLEELPLFLNNYGALLTFDTKNYYSVILHWRDIAPDEPIQLRYLILKSSGNSKDGIPINIRLDNNQRLENLKYIYCPPNTNLSLLFGSCIGVNYGGVTILCDKSVVVTDNLGVEVKTRMCSSVDEAMDIIKADFEEERALMSRYLPKANLIKADRDLLHSSFIPCITIYSKVFENPINTDLSKLSKLRFLWVERLTKTFGVRVSLDTYPSLGVKTSTDWYASFHYLDDNFDFHLIEAYKQFSPNFQVIKIYDSHNESIQLYKLPYYVPLHKSFRYPDLDFRAGDLFNIAVFENYLSAIVGGNPIPKKYVLNLLDVLEISLNLGVKKHSQNVLYRYDPLYDRVLEIEIAVNSREILNDIDIIENAEILSLVSFSYLYKRSFALPYSCCILIKGIYSLDEWVKQEPVQYKSIKSRLEKITDDNWYN